MASDWSKIYVLPFTKAKIGLKASSILNLLPPLSPTVTVCVVVVGAGGLATSKFVVVPLAFAPP